MKQIMCLSSVQVKVIDCLIIAPKRLFFLFQCASNVQVIMIDSSRNAGKFAGIIAGNDNNKLNKLQSGKMAGRMTGKR